MWHMFKVNNRHQNDTNDGWDLVYEYPWQVYYVLLSYSSKSSPNIFEKLLWEPRSSRWIRKTLLTSFSKISSLFTEQSILTYIMPLVNFYTPMKKSKNLKFSNVSREVRKRLVAWNGLKTGLNFAKISRKFWAG